jgi:hypothetical protein
MQVDGLPIFNDDTRSSSGQRRAESALFRGAVPIGFPVTGTGMARMQMPPQFAMMRGAGGGMDMSGMVVQVEMSGEDGTPASVQTAGFGNIGDFLSTLMRQDVPPEAQEAPPPTVAATPDAPASSSAPATVAAPQSAGLRAAPAPAACQGPPLGEAPAVGGEDESAEEELATPGVARSSATHNVNSQRDLQEAMSMLAMNLSRDLDRQRSLALSDEERLSETEQISLQYLQQVPELMRNVAPRATASIQSLLANLGHPSPSGSRGGERGPSPAALHPSAATAPVAPAPPEAPPSQLPAAPNDAELDTSALRTPCASEDLPSRALHVPAAAGDDGAAATQTTAVAASAADLSAEAAAGAAGAEVPASAAASTSKRTPKGLSRGLKRRADQRGAAVDAQAASAVPACSSGAGGGAGVASCIQAPGGLGMAAANPLMAMMAATGNGGGGAPPASLSSTAATPAGGADFASMMQSMMPMVSNMLGGGGGGGSPGGGTVPPAAGRGATSTARAVGPQIKRKAADVLRDVLGEKDGKVWADKIKRDQKILAKQHTGGEHSDAYTAGAPPEIDSGGGLF